MRVLLDTDVILDFLLSRSEFVEDASKIWQANNEGKFEGYISAITPINVFYIARKLKGVEVAREAIESLLAMWQICPLNEIVLKSALLSPIKDFEDATQHESAVAEKIDCIVTRNLEDYRQSKILVLSPDEFIEKMNL